MAVVSRAGFRAERLARTAKLVLGMLATAAYMLLAMAGPSSSSADYLFDSGHYREAGLAYIELLRQSPRDAQLLHKESICFIRLGQPERAIPFLRREAEVSPMNVDAVRLLADISLSAGLFADAHEWLARLTVLDPSNPDNYVHLGQLLYQSGYYSGAAEAFEHALSLPGSLPPPVRNECSVLRAISVEQAGDLDAAGRLIPPLVENPANTRNVDLLLAYVRLLYETGLYDKALAELNTATAIRPASPAAHFWKARVLQQLERYDAAVSEGEQARELAPDSPAPHNLLLRLYGRLGRPDAAAREAQWLREHETAVETRQ